MHQPSALTIDLHLDATSYFCMDAPNPPAEAKKPEASSELGALVRRIVDWLLVPFSVGLIANLLLAGVTSAYAVIDGWSWKTILALGAFLLTAGAKMFSGVRK
jgi:hypothetical protein